MPQTGCPAAPRRASFAHDGEPADALWLRLRAHRFDDPADARPLSARLAQAQGWHRDHAQRVLQEYRRFLYLALRLDGHACPSEAVDAAWHTHLLDSSRYFGDFCPRVLGRTLHHHPSRGGPDGQRHRTNYQATLRAYQTAFGSPPPADLWPPVAQRFAERVRPASHHSHWVLAKPAWWPRAGAPRRATPALRTWALLGCVGALGAVGCTQGRVTLAVHDTLTGPQFLLRYLLAGLALAVVGVVLALRGRQAQVPVDSGALHPVEQAYVADGAARAVWTAMAGLLQRGELRQDEGANAWQVAAEPGLAAHPLERALHAELGRGAALDEAVAGAQPQLDALHQRLHARGLLTGAQRAVRTRQLPEQLYHAGWLLLLLWGGLRALQGWQRGYPVAGLLVLMALAFIAMALFRRRLPHRLTREGRAQLQGARAALTARRALKLAHPAMPMALALLGASVLADELQPLRQALAPATQDKSGSSGCGGSGGCSGGGDGGGGCGGCGGD
jgi:uncharacterized protein (TIGR04222 family)